MEGSVGCLKIVTPKYRYRKKISRSVTREDYSVQAHSRLTLVITSWKGILNGDVSAAYTLTGQRRIRHDNWAYYG